MRRVSLGERAFLVGNYLFLGTLGLVAVYPFLFTLTVSVGTAEAVAKGGLHLFPDLTRLSFTAYKMVLGSPEIITAYANTLFRTIVGTVCTVFMTALCAYALHRPVLPHRRFCVLMVLFTMVFSGGLVPSYLVNYQLGLVDSRMIFILNGLLSAFNVIVIKNFFEAMPESLREAAEMDGAGEWRIFLQLYLPLSTPVLATVSLWTAVSHWNAWFDAMIYISSPGKQVMQNYLQRVVIESNTELVEKGLVNPDLLAYTPETIKSATVIITILPMLILYPFVQRFFVKGIMLGGVKG
jgi:putative aldouronate transport system permease protein